MAYRNLIVESDAELTVKNNQLRVKSWERDVTIPIEDIDILMLENNRCTLSATLLSALAKSSVAVFICDEFHMPCAVINPFLQHSRQHEITKRQLALTVPAKKQLWKQIISTKINNQARCLSLSPSADNAQEAIKKLESMAKKVRSGDEGHSEGHASAVYFPALFGKSYRRGNEEDCRNAWLNYVYTILRGCIARTLCTYGFIPLFGIHHHSSLNQFNLADDFIEPFRPLIDLYVSQNTDAKTPLSITAKRQLVNLISYDIDVMGKKYALSYGMELTVKSFSTLCRGKRKTLQLPHLVALRQHLYE
ncbi:MAG: type II CRISPR-associated endonuclease Cas1 [Defluviitaleaceae bacterium]|nr:type II CRISPR-associated endonuclease Cas1 [Defluviitaleaceae bacterium]MCL2275805.1 type II CRISPR-associated endonuclease Cas1 [Defluviitaleaceae bacterium]